MIAAGLTVLYLGGPKMPKPVLNRDLPVMEGSFVAGLEKKSGKAIRPGCEARILWADDSLKQPTSYALLYLHGFSATWREGAPVNQDFARRYGCNAYLARLASHGEVTDDPLIDMTPDRLYESAKDALVVARQLGKKVIIMGCSTGCTLALKLAADFPEMVDGLILYSPNIRIRQKTAAILSGPWGLQIARLNFEGDFSVSKDDPHGEICKYWYCRYRAEGPVYLQQLLDATMSRKLFSKVKCPLFMGYYYKDEDHQDQVVDVKAALRMFSEVGTPETSKMKVAFPEAGGHVISCDLTSGSVGAVRTATFEFTEKIMGLQPL